MTVRIISGGYIAPIVGKEIADGYVVVDGSTITAIGSGPAPAIAGAETIDAAGCLVTPGLVNTHHHLYQWASQGLAKDSTLFEWLVALYKPWSKMDAEVVGGAALAGLGWLAKTGCTTTTDHHYIFPKGRGDLFAAEIEAARRIGIRFQPCRGSMDRGVSDGGLPPDEVVETLDDILTATADAIDTYHDAAFGSMLRIAVAPCSPFSISTDLLVESAALARSKGVRLHTHLSETLDEEEHCIEQMGCTPVEYMEQVGWIGDDVWFAHAVHLHDKDIATLAATGTGVAHCPSSNARLGAGIARISDLLAAGAPVGLGVDGSASAEMVPLAGEIRQAMYMQRAKHGPTAMTARQALEVGTLGGATVLGRQDEIGSLEVGKLADIAIWRTDGFYSAVADPIVAFAYGQTPPLATLLVGGRIIVDNDILVSVPQDEAARAGAEAHARLTRLAKDVL